ncbi:hypothetical protein G9A89_006281 [Geosiphon pyriformis]|nr:hypothetical protein G9A89_006281 [Geosiphon pyriformis]
MIELVDLSAGSFGSGSADLETHPNTKKKHIKSVYFYSTLFKKPKKFKIGGIIINSSAGPISLEDIIGFGIKPIVSWRSEVGSITSSISGLLNIENMKNTVMKEISYTNSDNSVGDKIVDNTTSKKTHTHMYILEHPLKVLKFDVMSNNNDVLELPFSRFASLK